MTGDDRETKWMTTEEADAYRSMQPRNRAERRKQEAASRRLARRQAKQARAATTGIDAVIGRVVI